MSSKFVKIISSQTGGQFLLFRQKKIRLEAIRAALISIIVSGWFNRQLPARPASI